MATMDSGIQKRAPAQRTFDEMMLLLTAMHHEMDEDQLKQAVESQYGGTAKLLQTVPVREYFVGKPAWEGVIYVFDLERHPMASRAYAWLSPEEDGARRRLVAVLQLDGIKTPKDAVRAAIVEEYKSRQ